VPTFYSQLGIYDGTSFPANFKITSLNSNERYKFSEISLLFRCVIGVCNLASLYKIDAEMVSASNSVLIARSRPNKIIGHKISDIEPKSVLFQLIQFLRIRAL